MPKHLRDQCRDIGGDMGARMIRKPRIEQTSVRAGQYVPCSDDAIESILDGF
jgi:hypothetical protein